MESLDQKIERFLAVSYGYGSGSGDGDGYGSGSGSGYGDGSGDGDGDGYGYGSGDGSGYGDWKAYAGRRIYYIDGLPTLIDSVRGTYARGFIVGKDLVLRPCYIARHGDFFAHGDTLHEAESDAIDKWRQNRPLEERLADFVKTHYNPGTEYPVWDLQEWHHTLTGSCEMGRREFIKGLGLTDDDTLTVYRFIELTQDAYGGDVIRQLAEAYEKRR